MKDQDSQPSLAVSGALAVACVLVLLLLSVSCVPKGASVEKLEKPTAPTAATTTTSASTSGLTFYTACTPDELAKIQDSTWSGVKEERIGVPKLAPSKLPPGLGELQVKEKKKVFLRALIPHVLHVNHKLEAERETLLAIADRLALGGGLREAEVLFLGRVAAKNKLASKAGEYLPLHPEKLVEELLSCVDVIPPSLVLAQAAIESAWGSSRFALEGNNLFGQWVFNSSKGMAPRNRDEGANHSVARYDSITDSVAAYMRNLNSLWAYEEFRTIRERMRRDTGRIDSWKLAQGLLRYSTRRQAYVDEVRGIINSNRLKQYDSADLVDYDREKVKLVLDSVDGRCVKPLAGTTDA